MCFKWQRTSVPGYECSSKGDKRFSAFYARMPDGRTIEQHYQCDVKGYDIGGTNWKLGKGKPPLINHNKLWEKYLELWYLWAQNNVPLMRELYRAARLCDNTLTDMFATSDVNQARALAHILNDWSDK